MEILETRLIRRGKESEREKVSFFVRFYRLVDDRDRKKMEGREENASHFNEYREFE